MMDIILIEKQAGSDLPFQILKWWNLTTLKMNLICQALTLTENPTRY